MILPLLLSPLLLHPAPAAPGGNDDLAPPGLVALSGGRTTIGSDVDEIEELVEDAAEAKTLVRALDAETPQHEVNVAPFFLGLTEVTQEQYAAFVRATGYRPPVAWAEEALEEGRMAFFEATRKLRDQGKSTTGRKFDREKWWDENWKGKNWSVPEGDALRPVVNVTYEDAIAYCRWTGLRLPTEFEFQHACRGRSDAPYPWGDEWEDGKYAATSEYPRVSRTFPVGSFPEGASEDGILDLAGNVWEWTDSPYVAYPDFEKNEYRIPGQRKKETAPTHRWDSYKRIIVGGSYQNGKLAARCTVRRGSIRDQSTNALGFRVAGTPRPCRDVVEHIWNLELRNADSRPSGVGFDRDRVLGADHWTARPGREEAPEGYRVITDYDYLALVPRAEMQITQDLEFQKSSLVEPEGIAFLSFSVPVVEPALPAGHYFLAFRAAGETRFEEEEVAEGEEKEKEKEQKPRPRDREDPWASVIDITVDNILIFDAVTGELVAQQPAKDTAFAKTKGDAGLRPVTKKKWVEDPAEPGEQIQIEERWLRVKGEVGTRIRRRVLPFQLDLKMEPEFWDREWRGM